MLARWKLHALAPVPGHSLRALRLMLGVVMFFGIGRFVALGWTQTLYVQPRFTFTYWLFAWIPRVPASAAMYVLGVAGISALLFGLGVRPRVTGTLFVASFAWLQLFDVTNYLNHYYLVILLGILLTAAPWRASDGSVPAWFLWLVRLQVGCVYVHAGLAKVGSDWLLHAQPLSIWLYARTDVPVVGPLFAQPWFAYLASWCGCFFDLTIVAWLSWRRTRAAAYVVVLGFHALTFVLFDIGMFPFIMSAAATVFFDPAWTRRWTRGEVVPALSQAPHRLRYVPVALASAYACFQLLFPLRHLVFPGDVLWSEAGMRWSWKVMVREKQGSVTFHVRDPSSGRSWQVSPNSYLLPRQASEMAGQPDLVLQLAHQVAADFAAKGFLSVQVFAEAKVSLNGRRPALLIDPSVDLATVQDGAGKPRFVLDAPKEPPLAAYAGQTP